MREVVVLMVVMKWLIAVRLMIECMMVAVR